MVNKVKEVHHKYYVENFHIRTACVLFLQSFELLVCNDLLVMARESVNSEVNSV